MAYRFSNFARAKLATPPSGTGGLSFTVEAGKGEMFPVLGGSDTFMVAFKNASKTAMEIVEIAARGGDAFTIASGGRGKDGTTAQTWTVNDFCELILCKQVLDNFAQKDNNPSFTNGITVSAGSAAAPSISAAGDSNTGVFFPAAEQLAMTVNGGEIVRVTGTGLGVGTTPAYRLDAIGSTTGVVSGRVRNANATTGIAQFRLETGTANTQVLLECYNNNGANAYGVMTVGSAVPFLYYDCDTQIWRLRNFTELMRLTSVGLGVGCTPSYRLDVAGTSTGAVASRVSNLDATTGTAQFLVATGIANSFLNMQVGNNGGSPIAQLTVGSAITSLSYDCDLQIWRDRVGNEQMRKDAAGNFGIGRSPGYKLDVGGNTTGTIASRVVNSNATVGVAEQRLETGLANSSVQMSVWNNSGSPYGQITVGSAVSTFYYDCDTQIWRNRAGTENMRIDATGNVLLTGGKSIVVRSATDSSIGISGGPAFNTSGGSIALRGSTSAFNVHGMEFYAGGSERMRLDSNGNLAIGRTNPGGYRLAIDGGDSAASIAFAHNGAALAAWIGFASHFGGYAAGTAYSFRNDAVGGSFVWGFTGSAQMQLTNTALKLNAGFGSVGDAFVARAWVNFDGATGNKRGAGGNVGTVTRSGTGVYSVPFTVAMPDTNYCATITPMGSGSTRFAVTDVTYATGSIAFTVRDSAGVAADPTFVNVQVHR